jgi:hypothetical protein
MSTSEPGEGLSEVPEVEEFSLLGDDRVVRHDHQVHWNKIGDAGLQPEGVARFGFEAEPPEGWSSEQRRSLAEARLLAEIEDGSPEPMRFPWAVLLFAALFVSACVGGGGYAVWKIAQILT